TESRSSDRKLKPLPPDPSRHQDSAIAPGHSLQDYSRERNMLIKKKLDRFGRLRVTAKLSQPSKLVVRFAQTEGIRPWRRAKATVGNLVMNPFTLDDA